MVRRGKWRAVKVEERGWGQILQDFMGPDKEFGFFPKFSGKPLNIFKKSDMRCFIILERSFWR